MASHDRVRWDEAYSKRTPGEYPAPAPLLFPYAPPVREPGSAYALDVAAGLGQNGLWLAAQGYTVDLVDVSRVALTRAREQATARGLRGVNFFQMDLDDAGLESGVYDLIIVFRFLSRTLMPQLRAAVRPGGRVIYETFNTRYLDSRPDMNPDYLLRPGELAGYFGDWRLLRNHEPAHVSQVVAVKPAN